MKAGNARNASVAKKDADGLSLFRLQRPGAGQGFDPAVQYNVFGALVHHFARRKGLKPLLPHLAFRIHFTLHHIKFAVDGTPPFRRIDYDQSIQAVGDMGGNIGGGAVIHEHPGVNGFKGDGFCFPRFHSDHLSSPAGTGHRMQIDGVVVCAGRMILQGQLHRVAYTRPQ